MNNDEAEGARRKYRYRALIQRGDVRLPYRVAARLIGPDCAYHLYQYHHGSHGAPPARARPQPPRPAS